MLLAGPLVKTHVMNRPMESGPCVQERSLKVQVKDQSIGGESACGVLGGGEGVQGSCLFSSSLVEACSY